MANLITNYFIDGKNPETFDQQSDIITRRVGRKGYIVDEKVVVEGRRSSKKLVKVYLTQEQYQIRRDQKSLPIIDDAGNMVPFNEVSKQDFEKLVNDMGKKSPKEDPYRLLAKKEDIYKNVAYLGDSKEILAKDEEIAKLKAELKKIKEAKEAAKGGKKIEAPKVETPKTEETNLTPNTEEDDKTND